MFANHTPKQTRVALLSGGSSGEREVSIASGKGAQKALLEAGYQVSMLDPANSEDLHTLIDGNFDVAFLCLHGRKGEDGAIQGFLETINLPYTGSGIWSSALAIDKVKAKQYYQNAGIPTPQSITLYGGDSYNIDHLVSLIGDKIVVKPATEGSTLGICITTTKEELEEAIQQAFTFDSCILLEQFVAGIELTVSVLGNENPEALPIIEIVPQGGFYSYESKYTPGGSEHICPARLDEETSREVCMLAERAHLVLGCSGFSRSDFILDESGVAWILETNTLPGMTETSLLPDAANVAGISFPELCTRLIAYALEAN